MVYLKFLPLSNIMDYCSSDNVIKDKIKIPLRNICCDIILNQEERPYDINNYENYILNIIKEINLYMFKKHISSEKEPKDNETVTSTDNSYEKKSDEYMGENIE